MCSIIGYLGLSPAAPIIVKGLKRMEYRGYDSVGVATFSNNHILVRKGVGKVLDVNKIVRLDELSGVVAVFEDGTLAAARLHEPLIIGIGKDGYFISSDVLGFVESTDEVIYLDNKEFVIINSSGIRIFDFDSKPVEHQITKVSKEFADVYKGEYAHFTLKELSEQPTTIPNAANNTRLELDLATDFIN